MTHKFVRSFFHGIYKIGCPAPLSEEEGIKKLIDLLYGITVWFYGTANIELYEVQSMVIPIKKADLS